MRFSIFQIERIERLCRIKLSSEERKRFQKELSSILNWIDQLAEVDTSKVEPISQITGLKNRMRKDTGKRKLKDKNEKLEKRKEILKNVPEEKDGFIMLKSHF